MQDVPKTPQTPRPGELDRRAFLAVGGGALAAGLLLAPGNCAQEPPAGPFKLAPLPYPPDALEPSIDRMTMEIHHGKHHAGYVANLNRALADRPDLARKSLEELIREAESYPEPLQTALRNHGGGHHNHTLFWSIMKPHGGGEPRGKLAAAFQGTFGGFEKFKAAFSDAASRLFGSGWAWLVAREGKLEILSTPNQNSPLMQKATPILGLDVWEHAYYLKYQNRRADYIAAWWNVVSWEEVEKRLGAAG